VRLKQHHVTGCNKAADVMSAPGLNCNYPQTPVTQNHLLLFASLCDEVQQRRETDEGRRDLEKPSKEGKERIDRCSSDQQKRDAGWRKSNVYLYWFGI